MGSPGRPGKINPKWIGKNAGHILNEIGINVNWDVRTAFLEVPASHPLVWTEQMMPILPIVRVKNVDEAIDLAYKAEHGFKHTAVMHSQDVAALGKMGKVIDTAIFVKNAPSFAGLGYEGEGHTSFSIGTRTGEGMTTCLTFTRERRCSLVDSFRIV
jgi:acyl-CoA reductase-like NAD-dependent aldehyde dehydrogenase